MGNPSIRTPISECGFQNPVLKGWSVRTKQPTEAGAVALCSRSLLVLPGAIRGHCIARSAAVLRAWPVGEAS